MPRKIRVMVEIYDHDPGDEYYDLPAGWDDMTPEQQDDELVGIALEALNAAAGAGAMVVEVDENGKEK
jgi:hypothetical protein